MFAILFGAVDRLRGVPPQPGREEYDRTGDNHRSVVVGISATARVITSAAVIMVAIFGGFAANPPRS